MLINCKKAARTISVAMLLLLAASLSDLRAQGGKQTLSVSEAISAIEQSSGYTFFYNAEDLSGIPQRSVNLSGSINSILASLFDGTGIQYRIQGKEIVLKKQDVSASPVSAPSVPVVSGVVTDAADGSKMVGVAVVVKGTGKGTFTASDGSFSIEAEASDVLVFELLGYQKREVIAGSGRPVNVTLQEEVNFLDAVVMMGYSSAKRTELSSSVVSMQGDEIRDVTTPDLGNMLQGKVAGVLVYNASGQPGEAAQIRVRGTGSISASAEPLYVVDGIPGGSFNPNDIETITVLKDAGATALYGSDAAGGVIVVTTKKAKRGDGVTAEFKAQAGIKQALSGRFSPMDSEELYYLTKDLYSKAIFSTLYPKSLRDQNYDWMNTAFRLGNTQNYYASVSGSSDRVTYFASLDNYREKGTLINTNFGRTTGRLNLGIALADNLDLNLRLNYSDNNNQQTSSYVTLESAYRMSPWDNPFDENTGEYLFVDSAVRSDNGQTWWSHDKFNLFHNELYNSAKSKWTEFTTDMQLIWRITDHISATSTNRYTGSNSTYKLVIDPRTANASYPAGVIQKDLTTGTSFSTSNLLKYSQSFNSVHNVSALVGYEWGKWLNDYTSASGTDMKSGLTVLNASSADSVGGHYVEGEGWSVFGQAQYSYMEKYIVSASLRADANSVFAPKQRVGLFPSVSAAWLASSEDFMKALPAVSFLKVRASYGETGNSGIDPYSYMAVYSSEPATQYQGVVGSYPSNQANPYLHWERAKMTNLGFDLNIKKFLEVNVDLYHILNTELLLDVPTAPSSGFFSITKNSGSVRNMGVELAVNSVNINKNGFTWTTGFNFGLNRNTVMSIPEGKDIIKTVGSNSARQIIREGESLYSWYMPKWLGVNPENGDPMWEHLIKDEDGNVTGTEPTNVFDPDSDSQIVGCASPLFSGGLVNTLSYKGISLSFNFNYVVGNDIFNFTRTVMDSDGVYTDYNQMSIYNGLGWWRWEQKGDEATHPKVALGGNHNANGISSRYLEDGSFLRLKNVTLSYNIPSNLISRLHLREFKVFVTGDNLFTATRFSGMDPEVRLESTQYELAGMYSTNYPVGRTVTLGVNFKF